MSDAHYIQTTIERLCLGDATLREINPPKDCTKADLRRLIECLVAHPNGAESAWFGHLQMTDELGLLVAEWVKRSDTLMRLDLSLNQLTFKTYAAIAKALWINVSLEVWYLFGNQEERTTANNATFLCAFHLNPNHSKYSKTFINGGFDAFARLVPVVRTLGAPSMLARLTHTKQLKRL